MKNTILECTESLSKLYAEMCTQFCLEVPDVEVLKRRCCKVLGIEYPEAQYLLYQVSRQLNQKLFPAISKLELILTRNCNMACTYCFEKAIFDRIRMPNDVIRSAIDLFLDYSGSAKELYITLFGGEPTLNFQGIQTATEYVRTQCQCLGKTLHFNMTTNGLHITDSMVDYFAEYNIRLLFSVDGLEETHDRFRRDRAGRRTFRRVLENMQRIKHHQAWIGAKMTVMPETVSRLFENVVGLYELGVNQFIIGHASGIEWTEADVHTLSEQWHMLRNWYDQEPREALRITDFEDDEDFPPDENYFGCQAGRSSICVDVDGTLSSCAKVLSLSREPVAPLGDVSTGIFNLKNRAELVSCRKMKANWNKLQKGEIFRGGCFATNFELNGDIFLPSAIDNELYRRIKEACRSKDPYERNGKETKV